jgi:hypothetical protein
VIPISGQLPSRLVTFLADYDSCATRFCVAVHSQVWQRAQRASVPDSSRNDRRSALYLSTSQLPYLNGINRTHGSSNFIAQTISLGDDDEERLDSARVVDLTCQSDWRQELDTDLRDAGNDLAPRECVVGPLTNITKALSTRWRSTVSWYG